MTAVDMSPAILMNLQTAIKQQLHPGAAGARHVLLTFFNENPWQSLACQRGPVVPHSPGNTRFLTVNGACWHEGPEFLLAAGSSPARGTKCCSDLRFYLLTVALFDDGDVTLNDEGNDGLVVMVTRRPSKLPGVCG
ncbi:hypothetical protein [Arthrobacter sp. SDTb3-6]|uniref:hypothetical protein n=1 Tax=Arthrobacter sp. SDTb3-6 TaxID=2713571 RepID=UPI00159D6D0C|nr:hypothetical protein [Arthrobacter sp. SDTb3-6]NVM98389.1 hypothetical protein [Arthrobacter sp. SDTb3-6]